MHYLVPVLILFLFLSSRKSKTATLGEFNPVFQTVSGRLPNGKLTGNCFPACVASILGLPLDKVPFFSTDSHNAQLADANKWLKPKGLQLIYVNSAGKRHRHPKGTDYYLAKGFSPRFPKHYHVVVARNNKIVHDPHPDGRGLIGEPTNFFYLISL